MRHLFTLIATTVSLSFAGPALAAPGDGPQGRGGRDRGEYGDRDSDRGQYGDRDSDRGEYGDRDNFRVDGAGERGGRGLDSGRGGYDGHRGSAGFMSDRDLRKGKRLHARFEAERAALRAQLRQAERKLERLMSRPMVRPAKLHAARMEVLRLERKLSGLDMRFRGQLSALFAPVQVRFFLTLG